MNGILRRWPLRVKRFSYLFLNLRFRLFSTILGRFRGISFSAHFPTFRATQTELHHGNSLEHTSIQAFCRAVPIAWPSVLAASEPIHDSEQSLRLLFHQILSRTDCPTSMDDRCKCRTSFVYNERREDDSSPNNPDPLFQLSTSRLFLHRQLIALVRHKAGKKFGKRCRDLLGQRQTGPEHLIDHTSSQPE